MTFGAPLLLLGLFTLPAIWWLLRLTPPKPQAEVFPPLRLLAKLVRQEETPAQSPWWLTVLRLLLASLVIFALARPLLNPDQLALQGSGPVLLMVDNGWARPDEWQQRVDQARRIIEEASADDRLIAVTTTVASRSTAPTLASADQALTQIEAVRPIAAKPDRTAAMQRLIAALGETPTNSAELIVLSDGLEHQPDTENDGVASFLDRTDFSTISVYASTAQTSPVLALSGADNGSESLIVSASSLGGITAGRTVSAYDARSRVISQAQLSRNEETGEITASFDEPFQLRNDFAWLSIDGENHAGAVWLLDDSDRRRRVALLSGISADTAQPLLSPLFYIRRALEPFTDIIEGRTGDLVTDIPELLEQNPAMFVMADIGIIPPLALDAVREWLDAGGTLVRFAGPRLASQSDVDPLLPVELRLGERSLTGALSWTQPQAVASFPAASPFADIGAPADVTVSRQILAEPSVELNDRTWATLEDGTPLVTGIQQGRGTMVLFHVTAEATWSNLPISGTFVEMLRRIAELGSNTGSGGGAQDSESAVTFAPARILTANGNLLPPNGDVEPVTLEQVIDGTTTFEHPAGLYGSTGAFSALNAMQRGGELQALDTESIPAEAQFIAYPEQSQTSLVPWLLAAAMILLLLDTIVVLWINGKFSEMRRSFAARTATWFIAATVATSLAIGETSAQEMLLEAEADDVPAIEMTSVTRIAYVITGAGQTDATTEQGLNGLSRFIASRTALEPGEPVGVDLETDELAFFPLIYYAIDANATKPSDEAIARLDAYMQNGGTVLFDTRDDLMSSFNGQTAENTYLRELLSSLNIPPLEPVPPDHVLTKSFYILESFPGRYAGSPLWVEALPDGEQREDRPVRSGDGVSPILITGNDFAAAWALDEQGAPLAAVSGGDPLQRIYAFRTGVNIMMYMLTGNYKADQVHVPAILERLGQ
ncbi:MAG: DUF4159 domain-containing protein [Pseudomonadota bacterium]